MSDETGLSDTVDELNDELAAVTLALSFAESRITALEREAKAAWPVIFYAEDFVDSGSCLHADLEDAVESYRELRKQGF